MTEAEWLTCSDPEKMVNFLGDKAGHRRLRLFAAACCRRILHRLQHLDQRMAVEVVERMAEGRGSRFDVREAAAAVKSGSGFAAIVVSVALNESPVIAAVRSANLARFELASAKAKHDLNDTRRINPAWQKVSDAEAVSQGVLFRCIFGSPFRQVRFNPLWQTTDVLALSPGIYDDKAFDRLPILADALMDAACDDLDILAHCRSTGPHARGCWVVDLVLGKE